MYYNFEDRAIDHITVVDLLKPLSKVEKQIVYMLIDAETKTYIANSLNLTEGELRTKIDHIRNKIRPKRVVISTTKQCRKCNIEKNISEFRLQKRNSDGRYSYCKKCESESYKTKYKNISNIV